ncbi:hypothetical protein E2C01_089606 [Portunus trituberculatus]|uniref:Uncharacterized protein n=1 Tax=Portunus trituberculatus TaxID=210409 RepID=A0A5B7JMW7_PORTR|nr:hypothetical protein [Portunus trituberculatus]
METDTTRAESCILH